MKNDELNNLRHSAAHLLAAAVLELWPGTHNAIGPAIENGFYQDFDFGDVKITETDLGKIEQKMRDLLSNWDDFQIKQVPAEQAIKDFSHNPYKLELAREFAKEGKTITETVQGDFLDLCKGGHLENPKDLKHFKLLSIAGAYWRGSEKNKMLTRIYGTAFPTKTELDEYLKMLEEAKKRDHRKLGKELDLFFIDEEVGMGLPIWTPKGTAVKFELENFTRQLERKYNYQHVSTPYLGSEKLYKTSGHLDHFSHSMYKPIDMDGEKFYLRPMACPHHIKIFAHQKRSYRELPIRYAEIADYNRFEKSGELMGMIRVRKFQLTDAHIFVDPNELKKEFKRVCSLINEGMEALGIKDRVTFRFSKHDPSDREKYYPDPKLWEKSESLMKEALDEIGFDYYEAIGEAAFYGPKLDINARNVNGKDDTILTAQIDFLLPEKFDLKFTDAEGKEKRPVMIHRSAIGALERIFAFLIEFYGGVFPTWLAPVQVQIIPIAERHNKYAQNVLEQLKSSEIRVEIDERAETMQSKIRDAELQRIPYILVIGDKEQEAGSVSVRSRGEKNLGIMKIQEFLDKVKKEVEQKRNVE